MSREVLVIGGGADDDERASRLTRIRAAATRVPGAYDHEILETPHVTTALVSTAPDGGTSSAIERFNGGFRCGLGITDDGLATAMKSSAPHTLGAEAGHVIVEAGPSGGLTLTTDGAAFVPAYWARIGDEFYVSTHLASIVSLGVPPDTDQQGLAEYLVLMHPWGHRTLLRGVRLLGPGARVTWRDRRVDVTERPLYMPADDAMSDDDTIAEFTRLWPKILNDLHNRTSTHRVMLGLSGGLDSRAVAVGVRELGWSPLSYTYGSSTNREAQVARRVAERLELPHLQIPVTDEALLRGTDRMIDVLDGAHSPGEMYELWFDDTLRSVSDVIINGLIAGPLWGDDKTMGLTDRDTISNHLWQRFRAETSAAQRLIATDVRGDLPSIIRHGIDTSLAPWDFRQRRDMTLFWKHANKLLRWGSMLTNALRRSGLRLEAPFLDSRFLAFAARLTPEQRLNGNLYLRVHREALTPTADIPRSDDGNGPAALSHVYWSGERSFARQLLDLTLAHPVSGLRRGGRRAIDVAASTVDRAGTSHLATRRTELASVFPADLWARTRPVYADRLAALLDSAQGSESLLSDEEISLASNALRNGSPTHPALVLSRIGAAGAWLNDYRNRGQFTG